MHFYFSQSNSKRILFIMKSFCQGRDFFFGNSRTRLSFLFKRKKGICLSNLRPLCAICMRCRLCFNKANINYKGGRHFHSAFGDKREQKRIKKQNAVLNMKLLFPPDKNVSQSPIIEFWLENCIVRCVQGEYSVRRCTVYCQQESKEV